MTPAGGRAATIFAQTITPLFRASNYLEALVWCAMGIVVWLKRPDVPGCRKNQGFLCTLTLFAFGASDLVEASTGAWWHPWWLLTWKGACLAIFAGLLVHYLRHRQRSSDFTESTAQADMTNDDSAPVVRDGRNP